jgi:hypothetical protein
MRQTLLALTILLVSCSSFAQEKPVDSQGASTASAYGRLVDESTGRALSNEWLRFGIKVKHQRERFEWSTFDTVGSIKTDALGKFRIDGIKVGTEYQLQYILEHDVSGNPRIVEDIGTIKADTSVLLGLGDFQKPAYPIRVDQFIKRSVAPPPGEEILSFDARLKRKIRDAQLAEQQVLLILAPQQSDACRQFSAAYLGYDGLRRVKEQERLEFYEKAGNYTLMMVDTTDGEALDSARAGVKKLGIPLTDDSGATFAILDQQGRLIAAAAGEDLSESERLSIPRLLEFLHKHSRALPDAASMLADAFATAKRDDKRVLVQVSGAFCGPCVLLSRYLDQQQALIVKDYVVVKLDDRFVNGEETIKRIRTEGGGIPWMVILDADGKPLITSTGLSSGNIGFPTEPEEITHFEKMLRSTARNLTEAEIEQLLDGLRRKGK